ncbi:MAG TPA: hypothetical protein VKA61_04300 [Sphingomicrobium sp.]|nr:hypothetical protein [Sphingomicrobium sp.]
MTVTTDASEVGGVVMVALLDGQTLFDQHKFQSALPIPKVIDGTHGRHITLQAREISEFLGLYDPDGDPLYTTVWGYGTGAGNTSYPGPTILASEGIPITSAGRISFPWDIFCRSIRRSICRNRRSTR